MDNSIYGQVSFSDLVDPDDSCILFFVDDRIVYDFVARRYDDFSIVCDISCKISYIHITYYNTYGIVQGNLDIPNYDFYIVLSYEVYKRLCRANFFKK